MSLEYKPASEPLHTSLPANGSKSGAGRRGDNLDKFHVFCTENGSKRGQNLALTGLCVPSSTHKGLTLSAAVDASTLVLGLSLLKVRTFERMRINSLIILHCRQTISNQTAAVERMWHV